ncbi:Oidioi.mRNA.OKI2018_I69.chr2.g5110.t2.cds [Oikopleura dioica]|nr:Oidioi.mRNA.OKI2018_I69.chr2.g5110.t2.cds [Oikopleura dioica]
MQHYKAVNGSNTIAKTLWEESNAEVMKLQKLKSLDYSEDGVVAENEKGEKEKFDLVLLTIPVPQIIRDISFTPPIEKNAREQLEKVKFSSRFALVYFFGDNYDIDSRVAGSYAANKDDPIVYWHIDEAKRFGMDTEKNFRTIMFHFKKGLYCDLTPAEALPKLQEHVAQSFPKLPTPAEAVPHRWLFSQVDEKFPGSEGYLSLNDQIIICGDSFGTRGNFDGCAESASQTADHILSLLPKEAEISTEKDK